MPATYKNGLAKLEGGAYYYCFRINGRQYKGSTRATDLTTARKVLEEKRKAVLCGKSATPAPIPSASELVKEWVAIHQATVSRQHVKSVQDVTRNWILPVLGRKPIDEASTAMVTAIRNSVLEKGLKPATANHVLRVVSLLWRHAIDAGHLEALPFKVKPIRLQKVPRPIVGAVRVQDFLAEVDRCTRNPQIPVVIRVLIGLGLRESEALGMRWEWFDSEHRTYTVGRAKGREARVLPVPKWLWEAIHSMPKSISEWVFPSVADGKPHRSQFCKKVLERVCKNLQMGRVTPHRLRATFASLHAETGTPLSEIQNMLGHKNIATTMIYVETSLEAKRKAQDALSLRLGLVSGGVQ